MAATRPQRAPITSPAAATVFGTVLTQGPVSRVEVGRRTGLSSAAITKAARPFIEAGYLEELASEERSTPGAGRPPALSPSRRNASSSSASRSPTTTAGGYGALLPPHGSRLFKVTPAPLAGG